MTQIQKPDDAKQQKPGKGKQDDTPDPGAQQQAARQSLDGDAQAETDPEGSVGTGMNPP